MNTTLEVTATISACIWPIVVLIVLLAYRKQIPILFANLASRVSKLEIAGISIELAKAQPFSPELVPGGVDLRSTARAVQVNDSTARSFVNQLKTEGKADYAEVNLGSGEEWLTSRLYILAIIFAQTKELECFTFLETAGNIRKRYVGWAEPGRIRWALARRYPWFEQAYADAYSTITSQQNAIIVSNQGRLGYEYEPRDPSPSIDLLNEFLQRIQAPPAPPPTPTELDDWVLIDSPTQTYEHAQWIDGGELEEILGFDFHRPTINSSDLTAMKSSEQLRAFLAIPERFIAVVESDKRFEYLVDRAALIEQVVRNISTQTN